MVRNILFIMCDQLRADYLGCMGHPTIRTPHIDALARRGVTFTNAYCQAPVCGPSRMSFYTGRYVFSHGSRYNDVPLRIDEWLLGDYLRSSDTRVGVIGKTHFSPDREAFSHLGIDPDSPLGILKSEGGFEPWMRDDGLHPDRPDADQSPYSRYLRSLGYKGDNPWHTIANSALSSSGELLSGWKMRYADLPARVDKAHSETAFTTNRAIELIEELEDNPWVIHLSYIKPHWPYMAPAPYHALYTKKDVVPANRTLAEQNQSHPVVAAFRRHAESIHFARENTRNTVIPAYMGLITEIDDHIGRLMEFLKAKDKLSESLIVFTSDHGDYLGDHWLGEKELFHDESVRIPLIVIDPDSAADLTRGTINTELVESIDLIPTFLEALNNEVATQRLEGRSLIPFLRSGIQSQWRDAVFSEIDYAWRRARIDLGLGPNDARAYMCRTQQWKCIFYERFQPQLFNLEDDPNEQVDLGTSPAYQEIRSNMEDHIHYWLRHTRSRVTLSDDEVNRRTNTAKKRGILYGVW